ncbi:unnamed protein product [Alternaria alternata]
MDPFSISLGVLPLIHLAGKTAIELKKLQNGAAKAKDNINAMLADLRSLETVLTTIKVELEDLDSRAPLTGKIGEHWVSLKTILDDVCDPLKKLEALLVSTNKDVRWLSSTRRAIRLKDANDQIGIYRQSIQTYQDTLQLSLHFQQRTMARDITELLEKSRDLHQYFSRQDTNNASASRLKRCARTAATVVASASTVVGDDAVEECGDGSDIVSEFGWKVNSLAPNKLMSDWVASLQDEPDVSPNCLTRLPDLSTGVADNPPASQHTSTPGSPMTLSPAYSKAQQEITSDDSLAQPPLESSTIHKAETGEPGDMVIQESLPREDQTMVHKNKPPRAVCSKMKRIWTFVGDGRCGKTCFIK